MYMLLVRSLRQCTPTLIFGDFSDSLLAPLSRWSGDPDPGGAKDGAFDGDLCDIDLVSVLTERARVFQSGVGCGGRGFLIDCMPASAMTRLLEGRITRRICFNDQWVHHSALTARRHLR